MTDAHNPKLLSDADAAADLAGLPRPVREPSELALEFAARDPQCLYAWTGRIIDINTVLIKREELRTLVSERDALAVRVRELEWVLQAARDDLADWASYASPYFQEKHNLAGDLAAIDAALASKEQT